MKNLYSFYEVVKIKNNSNPDLKSIFGLEGAILGMSQSEETGEWGYAVSFPTISETWDIKEQDLETTHQFCNRSDFYSGETIRIIVDPETGEGRVVQ